MLNFLLIFSAFTEFSLKFSYLITYRYNLKRLNSVTVQEGLLIDVRIIY
jgi:hypothetical protein